MACAFPSSPKKNTENEFKNLRKMFTPAEIEILELIIINLGPPANWRPKNWVDYQTKEINPGIASLLFGTNTLTYKTRFHVCLFTFYNGCPTDVMDSWFHIRGLLKDRAAYNHVASIWANLRSRKWELDLSKRQYHFFCLHNFTYCHLDGTPFNNMSGVLYGEQINEIPIQCTQILSQTQPKFLSSEEVLESITGAEMCNLDEDEFIFSQKTQTEVDSICKLLNESGSIQQDEFDDFEKTQKNEKNVDIQQKDCLYSENICFETNNLDLSPSTIQEINYLHHLSLAEPEEMDLETEVSCYLSLHKQIDI